MINTLVFVICLVTCGIIHRVDALQSAQKEDLDIDRELKLINKPPVKSIQTPFGYIVDCIDINKQPAFDHPLLKNHKLQRNPNFPKSVNKPSTNIISKFEKVTCPKGTIPIRRTTKDDLIRFKSYLNNHIMSEKGGISSHVYSQKKISSHVARATINRQYGPYIGVKGTCSIYNPKVEKDQSSTVHIWVQNRHSEGLNKIVFGWHVFPQLYGDHATHIYTIWTSDNFKTTGGCYNSRCPGFIQVDPHIHVGAIVRNTSVYGGQIFETTVAMKQDSTKNWWLILDGRNVGYFPASLFSNLSTAEQVGWGGRTTTIQGTPSPPMGSGHFPDNGDDANACYFRDMQYNSSRNSANPQVISDKPNCYEAQYSAFERFAFQFGGPGGNCDD